MRNPKYCPFCASDAVNNSQDVSHCEYCHSKWVDRSSSVHYAIEDVAKVLEPLTKDDHAPDTRKVAGHLLSYLVNLHHDHRSPFRRVVEDVLKLD